MKILEFYTKNQNNYENLWIPYDNHENHGNPRIPRDNNNNHENHAILWENHENHDNPKIPNEKH